VTTAARPGAAGAHGASRTPAATTAARRPSPLPASLAACALLAALTLLLPSTPTYDPWAWLVWGRQLAEGGLETTAGPAWKPLTVAVAAVLAPLGDAAPAAWLLVARTAGLWALALSALLAARLVRGHGSAAVAAAALLAPLGVLATGDAVWHAGVGNAEGAALALLLLAGWWGLDGRHVPALVALALASLVRVEAWPLLLVAVGAAVLRAPAARRTALALAAAVPVLWLVPDRLGSGRWSRSSDRARVLEPGAPGLSDHPLAASLAAAARLVPPAVALGLVALAVLTVRRRAPAAALVPLGAALGWVALVAVMAAAGTSGEARYHLPAAGLLAVPAAVGAALLIPRGRRGARVAAALAALAVALPALPALADQWRRLGYEATLYGGLDGAVAAAGGAPAVRACGPVGTGKMAKPAVAWRLGVPLGRVVSRAVPQGTVFRSAPVRGAAPAPDLVAPLPVRAVHRLWTVHAACPAAPQAARAAGGRAVPATRAG